MNFCFHRWTKWNDPIDTFGDNIKVQSRFCTECNKCEVKKIKQPWNIWFNAANILARGQE